MTWEIVYSVKKNTLNSDLSNNWVGSFFFFNSTKKSYPRNTLYHLEKFSFCSPQILKVEPNK